MNAPQSLAIPETPGTPFAGGILLGRFFDGIQPFALIGAPKAELSVLPARMALFDDAPRKSVALSVYDGPANTLALAEAGSELAQKILALRIGGFNDWYLWSRGESLVGLAANLQGPEAFTRDWYWTSTQLADAPGGGWIQSFVSGTQYWNRTGDRHCVFAVRREPIR